MNHVYQVVLSSLLTKFVLKVLWSLDQWLGPTFPIDLVCIPAYLGCFQVCSGFSQAPHLCSDPSNFSTLHDSAMEPMF